MQPVTLKNYPQLKFLAWNRPAAETIPASEAFGLYERNWKHVDQKALSATEKALIAELTKVYGKGVLNV